jgi:hypothetical protein
MLSLPFDYLLLVYTFVHSILSIQHLPQIFFHLYHTTSSLIKGFRVIFNFFYCFIFYNCRNLFILVLWVIYIRINKFVVIVDCPITETLILQNFNPL